MLDVCKGAWNNDGTGNKYLNTNLFAKQNCGTCEHAKPRVIGFDVDGHQNRKPRKHDIRMSISAKNLASLFFPNFLSILLSMTTLLLFEQ
jgi:hypothetical protein